MNAFQIMITRLESASEFLEEHEQTREQEGVDKAINILQTLERWCEAYPESMFPPVTTKEWKKTHMILERANYSGSRIAADCMRHVTEGFKKVLHDE